MLKDYYLLAKPGMIYGNAVTVSAGFALASKGVIDWGLLIATLAGVSLVISSGCVFNNYIDRDMDAKMERTKNRALVRGVISGRAALIYGTCLGVAGFLVLGLYTNLLAMGIALIGFFFYVFMYSLWWKRRSTFGPIIGSISGAVPPVVGHCAVTNSFDAGAIIFFAIMVLWQIPHFYAISIYRLNDYISAAIPVLPIKKGIHSTNVHMVFYVIAFIVAAVMPTVFGYTGYAYAAVVATLGLGWLGLCIKGFWSVDPKRWARKMFVFSLVVIVGLSIMMVVNVVAR